jgi:hypothetical protein
MHLLRICFIARCTQGLKIEIFFSSGKSLSEKKTKLCVPAHRHVCLELFA